MNERERLMAVLEGKKPDRTPWFGDALYYSRMLDAIKSCGGSVKGLLWYQGCTDFEMQETVQSIS